MPCPDLIVEHEDCRCVQDHARYWVRVNVGKFEREDIYAAVVREVREQTETGAWRHWSELRRETAVAVAQRVAASLLWPVQRVTW